MNNIKPLIIGVVGRKSAGKSYMAEFLSELYNFKRVAFATKLKFVLKEYFSVVMVKNQMDKIDNHPIYDFQNKINILKDKNAFLILFKSSLKNLNLNIEELSNEQINNFKTNLYNYYTCEDFNDLNNNARILTQYFGTDICRSLKMNIWIEQTDITISNLLEDLNRNIIVEDIRFNDEFFYIKNDIKIKYNIDTILVGVKSNRCIDTNGIVNHSSEIDIDNLYELCDYKLVNDYTSNYHSEIVKIVNKII